MPRSERSPVARLRRVFIDTSELFPFTIMDVLLTLSEDLLFIREDRRRRSNVRTSIVIQAIVAAIGVGFIIYGVANIAGGARPAWLAIIGGAVMLLAGALGIARRRARGDGIVGDRPPRS